MSVNIQLNTHPHFTNLDFITGKVILSILNNETISAIVVKLEGESTTHLNISQLPQQEQLARSFGPRGRHQAELESHKLLYKVATVFPDENLKRTASENSSFTLPSGQYEYPFRFKIPFNNDCYNNPLHPNSNVIGLLGELTRPATNHVKTTLPPSLYELPGQAEIRYFVKVTVQRPAFFKENFRALARFTFVPIEPPRSPENRRESYARREHQFAPKIEVPPKTGFFRQLSIPGPSTSEAPPNIKVDGRLPDPAIITRSEPLPLRVLVTKLNESSATIYLQLLHVELVGYTLIRAHELQRTETMSRIITSACNMKIPLGSRENSGVGKDMELDPKLWNQIPLSKDVAPSFQACNITRYYALSIKIGLSYGSPNVIYPELSIQTLHMPVKVYSGVAPPPELLARMYDQWPTRTLPSRPQSFPQTTSLRPTQPPRIYQQPSQSSQFVAGGPQAFPEDAPPSYEDAIADGIGPVDGPRRGYQQNMQNALLGAGGGKGSGEVGQDERLFPESGR